jgi:hypothetical protein
MAGSVNIMNLGASVPSGLCCKEIVIGHLHSEMGASPPRLRRSGDRAFRGSAIAPAPPVAWLLSPPTVDTHPSNPLRGGSVESLFTDIWG